MLGVSIVSYTVRSSEKTRKSGADGETKALLYLMNFRSDSSEIHYYIVDFFNDLTGMDRFSINLWDVQSKAAKNNSPKAIGKELVTLFKNYLSEFEFSHYILFIGGVTGTLRVDSALNSFDISNITNAAMIKLIEGLKEEAWEKTYIANNDITDKNISDFLKKVLFVIDDKEPSEYVKAIIKNHPGIIPEKQILDAIFNELREEQSGKKNSKVEGITIQTTDEALNFCRHLTSNEIRLFVLQRIINRNPVDKGVPTPFIPIYNTWAPEHQKDMLDECKQSLCRALFNKNAANAFWSLFESIYNTIIAHPQYDVRQIYLSIDSSVKSASPDFDILSLKYFIAVVKEGVQDEN